MIWKRFKSNWSWIIVSLIEIVMNWNKFEILRRGLDTTLKVCTSYTDSDGSVISDKMHVKDLGISMSADCTFRDQINKMCQSAKNMCSWILRIFESRCTNLMLTLWKTLLIPILDYCSQLWRARSNKSRSFKRSLLGKSTWRTDAMIIGIALLHFTCTPMSGEGNFIASYTCGR